MNEQRRKVDVAAYQGHSVIFAQQHGAACSIYNMQCVIDGAANAYALVDNPRAAAEYLYAVADRIALEAGEVTMPAALLPAPKAVKLIHAIEEVVEEPLPRVLQPVQANSIGAIIAVGVALLVALLVTPWR